jgi:hypothetical protein
MEKTHEPYAHVLLFECRQCGGPVSSAITSEEANVDEIDARSIAMRCGACGWSGTSLGTAAKRHWVDAWNRGPFR